MQPNRPGFLIQRAMVVLAASLVLAVAGCGGGGGGANDSTTATSPPVSSPANGVTVFTAAAAPAKLSAWGVLLSDGQTLELQQGVVPYSLNTPLFSDYSHKFRTVWIPQGTRIDYAADGPLQFPVGAIVTKTFFYPKAAAVTPGAIGALKVDPTDAGESIDLANNRPIETRLMVREPNGRWGAVTYVWDADQQDATLVRSGLNISIELVSTLGVRTPFTYAVPTDAECVQCHATNALTGTFEPIGPQASNMNRDYAFAAGTANQLDHLAALQMLAGYLAPAPRMTVWNDPAATLEARSRAYLDVNCSSCHNPVGRSRNTGLFLTLSQTDPLRVGICKPSVGGQFHQQPNNAYDITPGNATLSFLYFRLSNYRNAANPPRVAMPELGRHVFHEEGNALVRAWINGMTPAGCP